MKVIKALDAANAREYSTVQPHTTGKYGPGNVPTAPFAQPEKGTIGLDPNNIRQIKQQAEALQKTKEMIKKNLKKRQEK